MAHTRRAQKLYLDEFWHLWMKYLMVSSTTLFKP